MHSKRIRVVALGIGLLLALGIAASAIAAGEEKNQAKAPAAATRPAPKPDAGVRVFIDPVTGKIREPEPEEVQQLAPAARRISAPAAAPMQGPGGAVGVKLDDSQMVYSVATRNADGTISFECVKGPDAAKKVAGTSAERRPSHDK